MRKTAEGCHQRCAKKEKANDTSQPTSPKADVLDDPVSPRRASALKIKADLLDAILRESTRGLWQRHSWTFSMSTSPPSATAAGQIASDIEKLLYYSDLSYERQPHTAAGTSEEAAADASAQGRKTVGGRALNLASSD